MQLWTTTGKKINTIHHGDNRFADAMALSSDGRTLAISTSDDESKHGVTQLWQVSTGQMVGAPLTGHSGPVLSMAFSIDGTLATTSSDGTTKLWDIGRQLDRSGAQNMTSYYGANRNAAGTGTRDTNSLVSGP